MIPSISVVIIGRNEGERLRRCLNSVQTMDPVPGGCELIYVDSGSSDGSPATAASFSARVIELRTGHPSAAMARNAGWRAARAPWVLFLDGDTILHPSFPRLALDSAQGSSASVIWGHRREIRPHVNVFHRVLDLDWVYAAGYSEFCGGDALMLRSALESADGFDETLIAGEEPELCSRLRASGCSILHIDEPMTGHDLAISRWSQYWRRAARAGYAYAQMAWRTRRSPMPLWTMEARGNVLRATVLLALAILTAIFPALGIASLLALTLRTAYRARWKSRNYLSLFCYGVHSHAQQIPILAGQFSFWWDLLRKRQRGLIEYK